ncbi:hypothetical protein L7F22_011883 [Adiantum nelumboides]|nr:hypothetical protein [Adiantum nelumboides]
MSVPRKEIVHRETLQGLKILVTDDNLINHMATKQLLKNLGCQAIVVESGRQFLATLAQSRTMYKLVLLNLLMPEMDAYEVAIRIHKNIHPGRRPLIIALMANTDKTTQDQCLKIGMDGVVLKPVSLTEMSIKLYSILRRARVYYNFR